MKQLKPPGYPEKVTLMFFRMIDEEVFIPIHLSPVTYSNLLATLVTKFDALKDAKVQTGILFAFLNVHCG